LAGAENVLTNILIILGSVAGALVFLFLVTHSTTAPARKESNDFTGAVVAVIGTTYAVILAFTLSGVWTMFQQAQANEEQEANALVNVYRIATHLQDSRAQQIEALCLQYADNAVGREWETMWKSKQLTKEGATMINQLWALAGAAQANAKPDAIAAYQLMEELRALTQCRRIRAMESRESLPGILWTVLIAGGIITVAASCFFGVPNFHFHVLQVLVLTFLISLVLIAISDIDRPYQGTVPVQPEGFRFALRTLHGDTGP
jgi:hypothetical protein